VFVMADDKLPDYYEAEMGEPLKLRVKHEEHDPGALQRPLSTPKSATPHAIMSTHGGADSSMTHGMPSQEFLSELPVRGGTHISTQMVHADLNAVQQPPFVEGAGMAGVGGTSLQHGTASLTASEIIASPHDTPDRRHSLVFSPPADFPTSANTSLYSQHWPSSSSAGPAAPPMYTSFAHQQAVATHSYGTQPALGLQPSQPQYLSQPYEPMPRTPTFDTSHGHIFRAGVNQGGVGHAAGYSGYLSSDARGMAAPGIGAKGDGISRPQMQ
jgi:hypothetical protein